MDGYRPEGDGGLAVELAKALLLPLGAFLLNASAVLPLIAGVISLAWLVSIGLGKFLLAGIGGIIAFQFAHGVISLPSVPLAVVGLAARDAGHPRLSCLAILLSGLWQRAVTVGWAAAIYWGLVASPPAGHFWPLFIWGYSIVGISLASLMPSHPEEDPGSVVSSVAGCIEGQIAYIACVAGMATGISVATILCIAAAPAVIELIIVSVVVARSQDGFAKSL